MTNVRVCCSRFPDDLDFRRHRPLLSCGLLLAPQVLDLSHCTRISDAALLALACLRGLRRLHLAAAGGPGSSVSSPVPSPSRSSSSSAAVSGGGGTTHGGVAALLATATAGGCSSSISDVGLAALAALRRLELLDLSYCPGSRLTGSGFAAWTGRRSGSRLATLLVQHVAALSDEGLAAAAGALRGLARLEAAGCERLGDAGVTCLARLPLLTCEQWLCVLVGLWVCWVLFVQSGEAQPYAGIIPTQPCDLAL